MPQVEQEQPLPTPAVCGRVYGNCPTPGTLQKAGYVFSGWIATISNVYMIYQPGETFLMPAHEVGLQANWVNQVFRTVHYWATSTNSNYFMRWKFPDGTWSAIREKK
jgi:hypothetical protein